MTNENILVCTKFRLSFYIDNFYGYTIQKGFHTVLVRWLSTKRLLCTFRVKIRTYAKIWTFPKISVEKLTLVGELLNVMGVDAWLCGKYCWQRLVSMKIILYK